MHSGENITNEKLKEILNPQMFALLEQQFNNSSNQIDEDNWDLLIDQYVNIHLEKKSDNAKRNAEIILTQLKHIMLGDEKLNYKKLTSQIRWHWLPKTTTQNLKTE